MADSYDSDKLMSLLDTTEHYKPEEAKRAKAADDHPKEKVSTQASKGTETVECEVLDDISDDPQETPQTLPSIPGDAFRPMPAVVALSAVFPSFRRPKDEMVEHEQVGTYDGHLLVYESGYRLNVYDEELVLAIFNFYADKQIHVGKKSQMWMKLSDLTRLVGRSHGGKNNAWVLSRLKCLRAATFSLSSLDFDPAKDEGTLQTFNILNHLSYKDGVVRLSLDPKWAEMFATFPISLIYSPTRMLLSSSHARVIHRILSTSNRPVQSYSEKKLIRLLGWEGTRKRDFWTAVKKAADELMTHEVISDYQVGRSSRGETTIYFNVNHAKLKPGLCKAQQDHED